MARRRVAAALAAVCLATVQAGAQTLTVGAQTPPSALDPHFHNTTNNNMVLRSQIFDALFEVNTRGEREPRLGTALRLVDDLTWEVTLREGVTFHDGTPFEPEDVAWTYARVPMVPNSPALFTPAVRTIAAVEVVDRRTIRIRTREPNPLLPWDLAGPVILSRRVHGPNNPATSEFNTGRLAIGTGPYRFASYAHNERLEVTRNPTYWGPAEPWERVVYRYIPQGGSRVAALLSGEVDMIDYVPAQDVGRIRGDQRFAVFIGDSVTYVYLAPDSMRDTTPHATDRQGRPLPRNPLADRRVREALSLGINRELIADRLYQGQAVAADQFASRIAEHRIEGLPSLPHDPARARALLAEAGYPEGFRLTIHGPNGFFPLDDNLLQAIAQQWARIGVDTQVQALPPANLFTRATNREFSVFMTYFSAFLSISPLRQIVMTRNPERGWGPFNRTRYSNPEFDALVDQAMTTMDTERREALTQQAMRMVLQEYPVLPIIHLRNAWAGRRDRVVYDASPYNHTSAIHARPAR